MIMIRFNSKDHFTLSDRSIFNENLIIFIQHEYEVIDI